MAQRAGRGIALLFHDRGTTRGWVVSGTPPPHFTAGKDPVPILQEAGWAPGLVWTDGKSRRHRDSIPDRPARSQSLYRLSYPAHKSSWLMGGKKCQYIWNMFSESGINSHAVYCVGSSRKQAACLNNNFKAYICTDNCRIQCCLSTTHLLGIYYTFVCFIQPAFVLVSLGNLNSRESQIQSRHSISSLDTGFELKYSFRLSLHTTRSPTYSDIYQRS